MIFNLLLFIFISVMCMFRTVYLQHSA